MLDKIYAVLLLIIAAAIWLACIAFSIIFLAALLGVFVAGIVYFYSLAASFIIG